MGLITAELLLIAFSAISFIIVLLVAWQFRTIKKIIAGYRQGHPKHESLAEEAYIELSEVKSDHLLKRELDDIQINLKNKTIELAKLARENEAKSEVLNSIKKDVLHIKTSPTSLPRVTTEILNKINTVTRPNENTFGIQIDELNKRFYAKLKEEFPELTTNDLRLCAYIKIGMSAKEIAELLHIKPSSVYISRSRLRKKLGLLPTDDLHGFLAFK